MYIQNDCSASGHVPFLRLGAVRAMTGELLLQTISKHALQSRRTVRLLFMYSMYGIYMYSIYSGHAQTQTVMSLLATSYEYTKKEID